MGSVAVAIESWRDRVLGCVSIGAALVGLSVPGVAQVIPDETLGEERSTVTRQTIRGIDSDRIDGGARRGQNLFHSFQQFDVLEGRGAYFSNPAEVRNIFSRVTGADPSEIMGRLGVLGEANLFFMNPNGILFGPNASLDVAGSFVGTTANAIQFGEQGFFSATNPETPSPLLAIDPGVLFFNQLDQQTGTISNSGNLAVGRDFTLSADMLDLQGQLFAGGNLTLQGLDTVRIRDSFTNPFIAASGEKLLVQGDRVVDIFALNHPNSGLVSGGDMVLRSSNQVGGDAHYWSGGNFRIERLDGSLGNLFSPYDPVIRIAGDLELGSYLGASLHILAGGSVTIPGFIGILGSDTTGAALTETVTLSNGTTLAIDGTSRPTVDIRAGVSPEAIGIPLGLIGDGLFPITGTVSDNATSADISVGYIGMFAPDGVVYLTNQYQPNRSLPSGTITLNGDGLPSQPDPIRGIRSLNDTGNGTSVIIDSRSNIDIPNSISTSSIGGNSGDVTLLADENISFTENGSLNVNTPNIGNAGNISIDAVGLVSLSGSNTGILSNVDRTGSGQGGNIAIRAGSLALSDGTLIDASTFGNGNAGRIVIDVGHGAVTLDSGSLIFNKIEENAIGDTGGIEIRAGSLSLSGASRIAVANSGGNGRLGNLLIDATDSISVTDINLDPVNQVIGSLITNRLEPGSSGIGGDVIISTGSLSLVGSQISASTFGTGDSGQVLITAGDSVSLTNNSAVFSSDESSASGDAGGIHIDANSLSINESSILALVRGEATEPSNQGRNGADVTINLRGDLEIISNRDSSVFDGIATAIAPGATGNAGDIRISARDIALTGSTSQLRSSLDLGTAGTAGNINIQARSLRILDKAAITTATLGSGNAGDISIQVEDLISLSTNSTIESGVLRGGNGNSGSIHLEAGRLSVTQGADISTKVGGIGLDVAEGMTMPLPPAQGNAGNINITVRGSAIFDGVNFTTSPNGTIGVEIPSGIASDVISESGGTGGDIALRASSLLLNNGAQFNSQTSGTGQAGDITIIADQVTVLNGSGIEATTTGSADAGSIRVDTNQLVVRDGSYFLADALEGSTGQAGTLTVNAIDSIEIVGIAPDQDASGLYAQTRGSGNAGNLQVTTRRLSIRDGGTISTETSGSGNGGNLTVNASEAIEISGSSPDQSFSSSINASVESGASGSAGNIRINTGQLLARDGGFISSSARANSTGNAGNVVINADSIELIGGTIDRDNPTGMSVAAEDGAAGNAGNLTIDTQQLSVREGASVLAQNLGTGQAGGIQINANLIELVGEGNEESLINASVGPLATGQSANIQISTETLRLFEGGQIVALTFGLVDAGDIQIRATDSIEISGTSLDGLFPSGLVAVSIPAVQGSAGRGGNINVQTSNLKITDGGQISASTFGQADAGNISLRADRISIDRSTISTAVEPNAIGQGGNITINTDSLNLTDRSQITSSTSGTGNTGRIGIEADQLRLNDHSGITSSVNSNAIGNSQQITLDVSDLFLNENSFISAATSGQGNAGAIQIQNADRIRLNNSTISTAINREATATAPSNITLQTRSLNLSNNSNITASTAGQGDAGTIVIEGIDRHTNQRTSQSANQRTNPNSPADRVVLSDSVIATDVQRTGRGRGGNIQIRSNTLTLDDGSRISARTQGQGQAGDLDIFAAIVSLSNGSRLLTNTSSDRNAGNITLRVNDRIAIEEQGSGIFASTTQDSRGNGGFIQLDSHEVRLDEGGQISAQSQGRGQAGRIQIQATGDLALNNRSTISTQSQRNQAGGILIQADQIEATNSDITTSARRSSGGNIRLSASQIRLYGDSDLRTNSGKEGGNIRLSADSIIAFDDSDIFAFAGDRGGDIQLDTSAFFGNQYQSSSARENPDGLDGNDRTDINASGQVSSGEIATPDTSFIQNSLTDLPETAIDTQALISSSCVVRRDQQSGSFTIIGTGGLPERPGEFPRPHFPTGEVRSIPDVSSRSEDGWHLGDPIVEPQGVYQLPDGQLVLSRECS